MNRRIFLLGSTVLALSGCSLPWFGSSVGEAAIAGLDDIFVIYGQSNASGRGINHQMFNHSTIKSYMFGNDYEWRELADPVDSPRNQRDEASADISPAAAGSVWPLVATYAAGQGKALGFIPCAKGAMDIEAFLPGSELYDSMANRISKAQAQISCIFLWQGETDALNGMETLSYCDFLVRLADAVFSSFGVKLMVAKLQNCKGIPKENLAKINDAIEMAWLSDGNILRGPDLSRLTSDDEYHLQSDENLQAAAGLWWQAIQQEFYL